MGNAPYTNLNYDGLKVVLVDPATGDMVTPAGGSVPTGGATAAKQDTGNTSLATIATNTTDVATSAKQDTGNTQLAILGGSIGTEYETVAASQTAQVLGGAGAIGDLLNGLLVIPANLNPGNVIILDNAISITVFAGGTASVGGLIPFFIPLGVKSVSGAWKVTTGADVSVVAVGNFT